MGSPHFCGIRVAQSLIFCVVLCKSLCVSVSLFQCDCIVYFRDNKMCKIFDIKIGAEYNVFSFVQYLINLGTIVVVIVW
jgi:hypothetical protein